MIRLGWTVWVGVVFLTIGSCGAQTRAHRASGDAEFTALLLSDIHFDPLRDPSKAERLMDAPEESWARILAEDNAPNQKEAFARLQQTCHETAEDTPYSLLQSSLAAMHQKAPDAQFALISGDLLVHSLACRFKTLLPGRSDSEFRALVAKTERFVVNQTRLYLRGMPVYFAMGNNDSACQDYSIDVDDPFFKETKNAVLGWLPPGAEKRTSDLDFSHLGDYSVSMPKPMQRTRLIVIDDLFQSRRYTDCSGKPNPSAVEAQLAWLNKELAGARARGERVWVMGHIPAGLDTYATLRQLKDVCAGDQPVMFLSSERMADVMSQYADVIRLGVFGHSHMDEIRLFGGAEDRGQTSVRAKIPIKMVSSITPLASGTPEFTVARVNPVTAKLVDYTVYSASNATGVDAAWTKVYSYGETYHLTEFSPQALDSLIHGFETDPDARDAASVSYLKSVVGGEKALMLKLLWPRYVCAMEHHTIKGYAGCLCPATPTH